jgi:hypothetical protein
VKQHRALDIAPLTRRDAAFGASLAAILRFRLQVFAINVFHLDPIFLFENPLAVLDPAFDRSLLKFFSRELVKMANQFDRVRFIGEVTVENRGSLIALPDGKIASADKPQDFPQLFSPISTRRSSYSSSRCLIALKLVTLKRRSRI